MNARRAGAYTNLMLLLARHAPAIGADGQAAIREAADTRLFATRSGASTERALREVEQLLDRLAGEGRVSPWLADHLGDDLEACGPAAPAVAAPG